MLATTFKVRQMSTHVDVMDGSAAQLLATFASVDGDKTDGISSLPSGGTPDAGAGRRLLCGAGGGDLRRSRLRVAEVGVRFRTEPGDRFGNPPRR